MALTNAFYEAVNSGNIQRVRIMMKNSMILDPTFAEFDEMAKSAASMPGLYDKHDGAEFINDRNLWNKEYRDKVMVKVVSNFSHERINHLKEVVRYLRPEAPKKEQAGAQNSVNNTKIGIGAAAGAAVGGVIAAVAGATIPGVIGSAVACAAVCGVVATVVTNGVKK